MKIAVEYYATDHDWEAGIVTTQTMTLGKTLTPEVEHILTHGQCHAFAVALHEILGWPIVGCYGAGSCHRSTFHFALRCPSYGFADAHGMQSFDEYSFRHVKAETILLGRAKGFLKPSMTFARHYAPMIAAQLLRREMKAAKKLAAYRLKIAA